MAKIIFSFLHLHLLLVVAAPAAVAEPVVYFDLGHGQRFLPDREGDLDLSGLKSIFEAEGLSLVATDAPFSDQALAAAAGVVVSGPFSPFAPEEIESLIEFVGRGGTLAVMLHIAPPAAPLIARLGGSVANGVVRETDHVLGENPLNFRVTRLAPHPLFEGIASFSLFGGWPLLARHPNAVPIAQTSAGAWVDLDGNGQLTPADAVQSFGVVLAGTLGKGSFVVFGDDAVFQNRFLTGANERLARNLARWFHPRPH